MTMMVKHRMRHDTAGRPGSGEHLWVCDECGRRVVTRRAEHVVIDRGDDTALHSGSYGLDVTITAAGDA